MLIYLKNGTHNDPDSKEAAGIVEPTIEAEQQKLQSAEQPEAPNSASPTKPDSPKLESNTRRTVENPPEEDPS